MGKFLFNSQIVSALPTFGSLKSSLLFQSVYLFQSVIPEQEGRTETEGLTVILSQSVALLNQSHYFNTVLFESVCFSSVQFIILKCSKIMSITLSFEYSTYSMNSAGLYSLN